jgi:tetratricopeptide (TPR) repeat protein
MKTYDIFLSHASADAEQARQVYEQLTAAGIDVWFDEENLEDHAALLPTLGKELAASRALLAVYSPAYHRRRACQWELAAAWLAGEAEALAGKATEMGQRVMVLTLGATLPKGIESCKRFASITDPAFISGIKKHLDSLPKAPMGTPQASARLCDVPAAATRFVGRTAELWQVHQGLRGDTVISAGSTDSANGGYGYAQLRGCGGMGKTLLAAEYAHRFAPSWPGGVFWLRAGGPESLLDNQSHLLSQYRALLVRLLPEHDLLSVWQRIEKMPPLESINTLRGLLEDHLPADQSWLWVVDDLPLGSKHTEAALWQAPAVAGSWGKTLITTRSRALGGVGRQIEIGELDSDAAHALLTSRHAVKDADDQQAMEALARDLGYYPLALDVAAALRAEAFESFVALRGAISAEPETLFDAELSENLPGDYTSSILKTLRLSLQQMPQPALTLLLMAAQLASNEPIPLAVLERAKAAQALKSAQQLSRASLVQLAEGAITLHPVVGQVMRLDHKDGTKLAALRQGLSDALEQILKDAKPFITLESQRTLALLLPHVEAFTAGVAGEEEISLMLRSITALQEGDSLAHSRAHCGDEDAVSLTCMNNLASTLGEQGDHAGAQARALQEQVLTLRWQILGAEHPATLSSMNNLASTLWQQGDHAGARALQEQVLTLRRQTLGAEHPNTLTSMNNLASTLWQQGDHAGARALQEQVLTLRRQTLGAEHPDTLTSMNNLASTLGEQGDLSEARALQEQVLMLQRQTQGAEHPNTLTSMNNLASTLGQQGDHAGARALQEQVLTLLRQTLGAEHPDTLTSMNNLAGTLWQQGDHAGARALQEQVLTLQRQTLGAEHPDTLTSMSNLAFTLGQQGNHAEARALQEQVLTLRRQTLGAEHPDTLGSMHNLACTLWVQGEAEAAIALWEPALAGLRRRLGDEHPTTRIVEKRLIVALAHSPAD